MHMHMHLCRVSGRPAWRPGRALQWAIARPTRCPRAACPCPGSATAHAASAAASLAGARWRQQPPTRCRRCADHRARRPARRPPSAGRPVRPSAALRWPPAQSVQRRRPGAGLSKASATRGRSSATARYAVRPGWQWLRQDTGLHAANVLRRAQLPGDLCGRDGARLNSPQYFRLWTAIETEAGDRGEPVPLRIAQRLSAHWFDLNSSACPRCARARPPWCSAPKTLRGLS
jgi:hypothetical protein